MRPFNTLVDEKQYKKIKMLGVEKDKTIQELVKEALEDLLKKYGKNEM